MFTPRFSKTATIASGQSLSDAVDMGEGSLAGIVFSDEWTAAGVDFFVSVDNVTYQQLYDVSGLVALTTGAAGADRSVSLDPAAFLGWRYVKVRSSTSNS